MGRLHAFEMVFMKPGNKGHPVTADFPVKPCISLDTECKQ